MQDSGLRVSSREGTLGHMEMGGQVRVQLQSVANRLKIQGSGFRVQGSGFRVQGAGRVQGSGFRVQGSGLRAQGSGVQASSQLRLLRHGLCTGCLVAMLGSSRNTRTFLFRM